MDVEGFEPSVQTQLTPLTEARSQPSPDNLLSMQTPSLLTPILSTPPRITLYAIRVAMHASLRCAAAYRKPDTGNRSRNPIPGSHTPVNPGTINRKRKTARGLAKRNSFLFTVWHNICIAQPNNSLYLTKIRQ